VAAHFGVRVAPPPADPLDGLHPSYLEPALRRAGLKTCSGEMDLGDLRHHTRRGRPVVCLVRLGDTGHYVVVGGVARGRVHLHCPARGPLRVPADGPGGFPAAWDDIDRHGQRFSRWGLACWA
jgi:hypothetical protein